MGKIKIVSRWDASKVLYEVEAETLRDAVVAAAKARADLGGANLGGADLYGANLGGADLGGANLGGANLGGAYLGGANLGGADLYGADLRGAYLYGADLRGAYLGGAYLYGADLRGAYLYGADLRGANLGGADLEPIKDDLFKILDAAPSEVHGLLAALRAGLVDGSTYSGRCACLVGTIAQVRGVSYGNMPGIQPDGGRPAERWFLTIRTGNTPLNHEPARITEQWILEWMKAHPNAKPGEFWRLRRHGNIVADGLMTLEAARNRKRLLGGGSIAHVRRKTEVQP